MKRQLERLKWDKKNGYLRGPYNSDHIRDAEFNARILHPTCCEMAGLVVHLVVMADFDYTEDHEEAFSPGWSLASYKILHCPFCGAKLPDKFEKVEVSEPVFKCTDGGYYCDTCGERCPDCTCLPREVEWKVVE